LSFTYPHVIPNMYSMTDFLLLNTKDIFKKVDKQFISAPIYFSCMSCPY